jgi:cytoplasmic iron level regulating protein YaaA (DUF328/UPF0246 family)
MKQLNTMPIEQFLDKAKIAIKSNQKNLTLDIKEVQALSDSLAVTMTRIAGYQDAQLTAAQAMPDVITVNMDGGGFR